MTISTSTNIAVGRGDGFNKVFNFPFLVPDAAYLVITYTDLAGVQTVIPAGQYTPAGIGNPAGGTITYPLAGPAIAVGTSLTVQRIVPYQQLTELVNQGAYFPQAVEAGLDFLELQIQQLAASVVASGYRPPPQDLNPVTLLPAAAARAGKFFAFDGNGNPAMLNGNLLAGDLLPYTLGGAAFSTPNYATMNAINMNAGWYVQFNTALASLVQVLSVNVVRTAGANPNLLVGAQLSVQSANGVTADVFGIATEAVAQPGSLGGVVGAEFAAANETNNNTSGKIGATIVFKDRADGVATVTQGLGANEYNLGAMALFVQAQSRSTAGEYCGWRRGAVFSPDAIDNDANGGGIGIDFAQVRYYGGANPLTAFRMTAALRFAPYQSILWNGDPTLANDPTEPAVNAVRTYFDSGTNRIKWSTAGVEMFAISTTSGDIYRQGVLVTPVSTSSNNTWSGTNTFNATFTLGTDLVISGAHKLLADFSNATLTNRAYFQSSVVNGTTNISAVPNGASVGASLNVFNSSTQANCAFGQFGISNAECSIQSTIVGAGAVVPLTFYCGIVGSPERMRLSATNGSLLINTTADSAVGAKLRVNGLAQIDNVCAVSVNRNGTNQGGVATATFTKVQLNTKRTDQNGNFDATTNFRWTPPAGTYVMMANAQFTGLTAAGRTATIIYKNGAAYFSNNVSGTIGAPSGTTVGGIDLANGTDYYEMFVWHNTGGVETISGLTQDTFFTAVRIG